MKKKLRMIATAGALSLGLLSAGQAHAATPTVQTIQYQVIVKYIDGKQTVSFVKLPAPTTPGTTTVKAPTTTTQEPAKAPTTTTQEPAKAPTTTTAPAPAPAQTPAATTGSVNEFEKKVFELVNQERAKAGLKALQLDTKLSEVARAKSADMKNKGYFSHQSPTYGSPFDMMKQFGITYKTAGENIAKGQKTPEEVMKAWMNSDGHRKNILSANFTHIGVGYVDGHWTQMFIGK
ncbi:CAP domain-containing protein [Domibacillus indicus]|uniref:CAP domain-containing protein n=1 Tax=Domibacillus indicus TaxID=1437523 RepID=UPI0020400653|nr:CAP domain-containing protein [Domibacillus indicus]MCM3790547.1 CAP domain-containing protein [Domibacillus indicus]